MISSDDIMNFLVTVTEGHKSSTKKLKYSLLKTFFNFIKNSIDQSISNPCDSPILKKIFKAAKGVFIPKKVAVRLREYIALENIKDDNRVFPLGYTRTREIVKNAGNKIGVFVKPHDLRRHAATYVSRSGVPIEIVSKIILRHSNLSTTQRYLGKASDNEAIYWIENIYR
ncbi:site-specific integrase [Desulfobacula sp.]|uniref:site-specific integrase n=1 Tax=Desulfobacula sp. TaxID=2593537 RepID=UPI0025C3B774|nr:site-specific integrase [Desulfobacula sp.]